MKITITRPVEIEVTHIKLELPVRYEEEDMPNDFPLRVKDRWVATIDLETGYIEGWPAGKEGEFYMKVCDEGVYTLLARAPDGIDREIVAELSGEYVPHGVVPGEYGDYVHLKINGHGIITNWPRPGRMKFDDFFPNGSTK